MVGEYRGSCVVQRFSNGLGDKAYVGAAEMLTELSHKRSSTQAVRAPLSACEVEWNLMVQHYRGGTCGAPYF